MRKAGNGASDGFNDWRTWTGFIVVLIIPLSYKFSSQLGDRCSHFLQSCLSLQGGKGPASTCGGCRGSYCIAGWSAARSWCFNWSCCRILCHHKRTGSIILFLSDCFILKNWPYFSKCMPFFNKKNLSFYHLSINNSIHFIGRIARVTSDQCGFYHAEQSAPHLSEVDCVFLRSAK